MSQQQKYQNIKNLLQDSATVGLVAMMAIALNIPSHMPVDIDRKYLIGALAGIIAIALVKYIRFTLVLATLALVVGANIPQSLAAGMGFEPWVLTVTLLSLVALGLVHRLLKHTPSWLDPNNHAYSIKSHLYGVHAMFKAIEHGRDSSVAALLRQGVDPDVRAAGGETPLMYAAARNRDMIVQMLIDNGADASLRNDEGYTALKVAEIKGYRLIAALLAHAGATE